MRWDIFCKIIDNFGDIGVCWRLARQLTHEHHLDIRLWIDELNTAKKLIPSIDETLVSQTIDGVEICHWCEPFNATKAADVVIEAFACELPQAYLAEMARTRPVWLNLEYLSAENWVADFHAKASPHPTLGLTKYFFFPGFTAQTGGLIREHDLIAKRDVFQGSKEEQNKFWQNFGIKVDNAITVSLFCYPHAPVRDLLECLALSSHPILLFVPDSPILKTASKWLGKNSLDIGGKARKGNLTLHVLPFLSQEDYDHLLWACDINFVRGEDSWIRGLWAAKPMIWQPYHQQENTHLTKLDAFLDVYSAGLGKDCADALADIHKSWCGGPFVKLAWQTFLSHLPELKSHATSQSCFFAQQADLATNLMNFCEDFLKK